MNIIEYITSMKKITQKTLAKKLNVSTAQISKWKAGEYISSDREEELIEFCGLFGNDFEHALLVKTERNHNNWIAYFKSKNTHLEEDGSYEFNEDPEGCSIAILEAFIQFGIPIPNNAPTIKGANKVFDELVSYFFINYGCMSAWSLHAFPGNEGNDLELHNLRHNIDSHNILVSIAHLSALEVQQQLLTRNNTNINNFTQCGAELVQTLNECIADYCNGLTFRMLPVGVDYFNYINTPPNKLMNQVHNYHEERCEDRYDIGTYFSYAEKTILNKLGRIQGQLVELQESKS